MRFVFISACLQISKLLMLPDDTCIRTLTLNVRSCGSELYKCYCLPTEFMSTLNNPFGSRATLDSKAGQVTVFRLNALAEQGVGDLSKLPFSIKVLLESALLCNALSIHVAAALLFSDLSSHWGCTNICVSFLLLFLFSLLSSNP